MSEIIPNDTSTNLHHDEKVNDDDTTNKMKQCYMVANRIQETIIQLQQPQNQSHSLLQISRGREYLRP